MRKKLTLRQHKLRNICAIITLFLRILRRTYVSLTLIYRYIKTPCLNISYAADRLLQCFSKSAGWGSGFTTSNAGNSIYFLLSKHLVQGVSLVRLRLHKLVIHGILESQKKFPQINKSGNYHEYIILDRLPCQ